MIVLMLAVFFAVLSIVISLSVDNSEAVYNTGSSVEDGSGSSAGKVGLVVEPSVNNDNQEKNNGEGLN